VNLSITHKSSPQDETEFDVREAGKAAPHNGVARRRVLRSSEITDNQPSERVCFYAVEGSLPLPYGDQSSTNRDVYYGGTLVCQ